MPNPPAFKEVWIAQRTDNPPAADGSPDNPYDGSTQAKFDTLMGLLAANTVIHLSPGKYTTLGYTTSPTPGVTRWSPRAGWRILGGGMGNTEIKILDDPTDPLRVHVEIIGGSVNNLTDFAEVSDLTANCNLAARSNASPYVSGAIHLVGDFCLISRVLAINWGTTSGPPLGSVEECFVLSTVSYFGPPSVSKIGGIVEGCIVTRPDPGVKHNDGVTAIFQSIGPTINPVQRHNFVYAIPIKPLSSSALGAPIYANPYSMPGCIGGLISENAVFDCQDHAIYADSSNVKHTLITANQFLRVWRGIRYRYYNTPPWEVSYLTVLNNFISLRDTALGVGIQLGIAGSFGGEEVIEPFVHGNMVSLYDGISAPGGLKGIDLYSAKKVSIADNLLALPPTASLITTDAGVTQAQYYNNRNSIGLPQPEMASSDLFSKMLVVPELGYTPYYSEILLLANQSLWTTPLPGGNVAGARAYYRIISQADNLHITLPDVNASTVGADINKAWFGYQCILQNASIANSFVLLSPTGLRIAEVPPGTQVSVMAAQPGWQVSYQTEREEFEEYSSSSTGIVYLTIRAGKSFRLLGSAVSSIQLPRAYMGWSIFLMNDTGASVAITAFLGSAIGNLGPGRAGTLISTSSLAEIPSSWMFKMWSQT